VGERLLSSFFDDVPVLCCVQKFWVWVWGLKFNALHTHPNFEACAYV
jgi:hypothetical protein